MKKIRSNRLAGFTLDQTILVVAVIAVLATIIISSVAWNVLNRANATKLNAHLTQINDAIGQFYQDNDYTWPQNASQLAPYLTGYDVRSSDLLTPFGGSGADAILKIDGNPNVSNGGKRLGSSTDCSKGGVDCYVYITISNVQVQEMKIANESIDGKTESNIFSNGRLQWDGNASTADNARVTLKYWAVKLY